MANEHRAKLIAGNLDRAGRFTHGSLMLALVVAAREHHTALTATGTRPIESFQQGGLDYLWVEKKKLGLPQSVTKAWTEVKPAYVNPETLHTVHPAWIPARDQMMVYAAQVGTSFRLSFRNSLTAEFGAQAGPALAGASRLALLVWMAYAFLAPGGAPYDGKKSLREQLGQTFGHRSALGLYADRARQVGKAPSLDDILTDSSLDHLEWLHSAKTRAAETLFLEQLLKRARQLLRH
jgi:hypothetical protein